MTQPTPGTQPALRSQTIGCPGLAVLALLLLGGCASTALPTYPWTDHDTAIEIMSRRARQLRTLSARCDLTMENPQGTVNLDAAIAMRKPGELRLRAWKFSQAVFDLTVNGEGVFVAVAEEASRPDRATMTRMSAHRFARAWSVFNGDAFAGGSIMIQDKGGASFVVRETASEDTTILCTVDRATLTPTKYELLDEEGTIRFTLKLERYRQYGSVLFPTLVSGQSKAGAFTAQLSDVLVNQNLPDNSFVPPGRAEKLR